jgi:hypothetical protein
LIANVDEGAMVDVYVIGILKERHDGRNIQNPRNCITKDIVQSAYNGAAEILDFVTVTVTPSSSLSPSRMQLQLLLSTFCYSFTRCYNHLSS